MRVVHFSDWHASLMKLPEADLYICTGDMMNNYPLLSFSVPAMSAEGAGVLVWDPSDPASGSHPPGAYLGRRFVPGREKSYQELWCEDNPFRENCLPDRSKPVVVVRGNHDFCDLGPWIGGQHQEIVGPEDTFELMGLKFGGMRGVPRMYGEWSDELWDHEFDERVGKLPMDIDVLVTHSPISGVLDEFSGHAGSRSLSRYVNARSYSQKPLRAHCFGHIHESGGKVTVLGGTVFSNAALGYNVFDL